MNTLKLYAVVRRKKQHVNEYLQYMKWIWEIWKIKCWKGCLLPVYRASSLKLRPKIYDEELRKYNDIKNLPCRFPPQTYVSTLSSVSSQPCHLYTYPSDWAPPCSAGSQWLGRCWRIQTLPSQTLVWHQPIIKPEW